MYKAVYFNGDNLNVEPQEYLKKHQLVFETPQYKGYDGFPVGNGTFGGMVYHSKSKIHFCLNHVDAIDFRENGNFAAWSGESEEKNTAHVSCGHLTITDFMPSFDTLYLKEYMGKLDIGDGGLNIQAKTDFSNNAIQAFANEEYQMEVISYSGTSTEEVIRGLELSRWGSRNFFHDYEQISNDRSKNLNNISCGEINDCIFVSQKVRGCETLTLLYVAEDKENKSPNNLLVNQLNNQTIQVLFEKSKALNIKIFIRVIVSENIDKNQESNRFVTDVQRYSYEQIKANQRAAWKEYWRQSFIYLPEDEYLENVYYIYSYLLNCCSKGKYPITFGSIWCHNHDTRNWGHYYHWNHQQIYWGLWKAGKEELCKNYLDYRFDMLPNAIEDGKRLFGIEGAFFSDISNYNGYQALEPDTVRNLTCGVQIALDFYRYFCYTNDESFLKTKAYPFMTTVMNLYEGLLEKSKEGYYEIHGGSTCYESYWNLKQTITDHVMVIALTKALIHLGTLLGEKEEKINKWIDYQTNIYPISTTPAQWQGEETTILSAGMKWNDEVVTYGESEYPLNTFGLCQLSGVYPAEIVNLVSPKEDLILAKETAKVIFRDYAYSSKPMKINGHSMAPIIAARLGMREDTIKLLHLYLEGFQCFKNGLCHFANIKAGQFYQKEYLTRVIEPEDITDWEKVHEKSKGYRVPIDSDDFTHCYFEAHGEIFMAVNEMLLQSHDGIIFVFPSTPEHYSGTFSLKVEGGHEVTSQMEKGEVRYIAVKAAKTEAIKIASPWNTEARILCKDAHVDFKWDKEYIYFHVKAGNIYIVEQCQYPLGQYYQNKIPSSENKKVKYYKNNQIGLERRF